MGPRGDAIVQFDACVGELLGTLDRLKLTDNTLVILSSDNGPVLNDGYKDGAVEKLGTHKPAGPLRGGKGSIWEGGTRVPLLVRWPARVKPGVSDAIVSQVDFCASLASLTGQALAPADAPDSCNVLPALLGESPSAREQVLEHSGRLAIRAGRWKFIPAAAGGDANQTTAKRAPQVDGALYDLSQDPAESTNVAGQHPEVVEKLSGELARLRAQGRSRP
jgi:arylsulfatase A-like enzyme